jgi:hypothetical protein
LGIGQETIRLRLQALHDKTFPGYHMKELMGMTCNLSLLPNLTPVISAESSVKKD